MDLKGRPVVMQVPPNVPGSGNSRRLYGFDDTRMGVLRNPEVSVLLNQVLAGGY